MLDFECAIVVTIALELRTCRVWVGWQSGDRGAAGGRGSDRNIFGQLYLCQNAARPLIGSDIDLRAALTLADIILEIAQRPAVRRKRAFVEAPDLVGGCAHAIGVF